MSWKTDIILTNFKANKLSNIINALALSLAVILFALFSGFYLSQHETINEQALRFPEYLCANIEKSEEIESESSFLKLKQVSRPSLREVESFLSTGISAKIHLNYTNLFLQDGIFAYGKKLMPALPVFLENFDFDHQQIALLKTEWVPSESVQTIYVNDTFISRLAEVVAFNDYQDVLLSYTLVINNQTISKEIIFNLKIVGIFEELEYLSSPKIYFSQQAVDEFFIAYDIDEEINIYEYISDLAATDESTSYSYRMYFASLEDLDKAKNISASLSSEDAYLNIVGEHLSRLDSLKEMFNFINITLLVSLILIVVSLLFINVTITHREISKANAKNALLYYFGAKTSDIIDIYLGQNLVLVSFSMGTLIFVPYLSNVLNSLMISILNIKTSIEVPLLIYREIPFLIPVSIFIIMYVSASVITIINIYLKNQKTLIKRLAHND